MMKTNMEYYLLCKHQYNLFENNDAVSVRSWRGCRCKVCSSNGKFCSREG